MPLFIYSLQLSGSHGKRQGRTWLNSKNVEGVYLIIMTNHSITQIQRKQIYHLWKKVNLTYYWCGVHLLASAMCSTGTYWLFWLCYTFIYWSYWLYAPLSGWICEQLKICKFWKVPCGRSGAGTQVSTLPNDHKDGNAIFLLKVQSAFCRIQKITHCGPLVCALKKTLVYTQSWLCKWEITIVAWTGHKQF